MHEHSPTKSKALTAEQFRSIAPSFLLIFLAFLSYLLWSLTLPMIQCPDEYMRIEIPLYILQNGELPNGFDEAIRNYSYGTSYAFAPYGTSLFAVLFMSVTSIFTSDTAALVVSARLVSVISGAGTVAVCLMIGKMLFKKVPVLRYLFAVLVGFLPQFIFLSSYFNCDAFAVFSTALIFYAWIRGLNTSWDKQSCCILGLGLGFCLMSYYSAYAFVLMSIILFFGSQITMTQIRNPKKEFLQSRGFRAGIILFIALALSLWFFVRNAILYDGDFLGMTSSGLASELYAIEGLKPSQRATYANKGLTYMNLLTDSNFYWTKMSLKSFIGVLGGMNIFLPRKLYYCYYLVFLIISIFSLVTIIRVFRKKKQDVLLVLACIACIIIPVLLSMYYSVNSDFQPQGRYFMSALIPLMFLATMGLYQTIGNMKRKLQMFIVLMLTGVYISLAICVLFFTILPQCTVPFMEII